MFYFLIVLGWEFIIVNFLSIPFFSLDNKYWSFFNLLKVIWLWIFLLRSVFTFYTIFFYIRGVFLFSKFPEEKSSWIEFYIKLCTILI